MLPLMYSALAAPYGTVLFLGRGWKAVFQGKAFPWLAVTTTNQVW